MVTVMKELKVAKFPQKVNNNRVRAISEIIGVLIICAIVAMGEMIEQDIGGIRERLGIPVKVISAGEYTPEILEVKKSQLEKNLREVEELQKKLQNQSAE